MAKKIIGVENLNVIRDFVLSKIMTESDDIRRTLTEENAEYLHNKLLEASESLKTDYESKYEHLNNRIDTLKSEGANAEELREIELQIDALNNNYADMQNGLSAIEDSIIDIENSVMSPGQLNELIDTALIERTTITEDMVSTPNVYTQNIVALIAKFGTVRALNIVGDEIQGKTISAYDKISGTDEPTWKLDRQGNGYLANKNISWDKDGNVTFGEKVKIGWGSVTDTPDDFGSGISIFTSTVFTRNNEKPSKPTGGSYSKPTPDESVWTDGIPDGDMILWASTRVFASDGGSKQQASWTDPVQMTDTSTLDIEYSSVVTNPGNPTDNPNNWSNNGDSNTVWMATATISNGVKGAWTITKIKGEDGKDGTNGKDGKDGTNGKDGKDGVDGKDGKDGKDGTSISIAGTFPTESELRAAYPNGPDPVTNAYVVGTDLYVWASGSWKNVGQFTGKDGVNGKDGADGKDGVNGKDGAQVYLHIKYADSIAYDLDGKTVVSVDWTDDNGEVRGPYQGMYSDYVEADSTDCTKYKWFQIDAEKAVQTEIGKYKITSNTISGKTIHSTTEIPLVDGTTFETFDDDGKSLGTTTSDGTIEGPAWQLRNLGDGYLAKGNIRWDAAGNVEFGPNVTIGWNDEWDEKIPDIPEGGLTESEVENMISTEISKYEVKAENIKGTTLEGKTIKSSDDAWMIGKDGDGWLANKNISWDEDGNLEVKGNIKGVIGDADENVDIDGDLVIRNNGSMTTVLSGNHNYENPLDEQTNGRNITFSSGFCDTLYVWNIDAAQPVTVADSIIDGFIPTQIYTKYQYEDSKNGTEVPELYYEYDGKIFVWIEYDSAKVNSKTVVVTDSGTEYVDGAYISVKVGSVTYKYNYVNEPISIANNANKQIDTANTNIFSDGSIYTNSLVANDGQFYGRIYSGGEFSGKLKNVTGTLKDTTIKNANITMSNNNTFNVHQVNYIKCSKCNSSIVPVKLYDKSETYDFSTKYKTIAGNRVAIFTEMYTLFNMLKWKGILSNWGSTISMFKTDGYSNNSAVIICSDVRAIKDCTDEDMMGIMTVAEAVSLGGGNYPIGFIHTVGSFSPSMNQIPMKDANHWDKDASAIKYDILNIKPNLKISGQNEISRFGGASWGYQERDSKSTYTKTYTTTIGNVSVSKDTQLVISGINVSMSGYQPREGEGNKTNPKLYIYWKYKNNSTKYDIHTFNTTNCSISNSQYNNRQHTWVGSSAKKTFNITKDGDVEIIAQFTATCTGKQLWDYPYISMNIGSFTTESKSSFVAENNTITISNSGVIVKSADGCEFSTVGGELRMLSKNMLYGIKVTDSGVQICRNGTWSTL